MEKENISRFLKGIELFKNLSDGELRDLAEGVREKRCVPGDLLFSENSPREDIFVIYEGEVELFKNDPYGIEVRLALLGKGDFIGEGIWEEDSLHSTSARAVGRTTLLDIHRDFFRTNPGTTLKILANITRVISGACATPTRGSSATPRSTVGQHAHGARPARDREVPRKRLRHQTLRAVENFNISVTLSFFPTLIQALAMVKEAAAEANFELGLLGPDSATPSPPAARSGTENITTSSWST